ncbi:hypothetical protein Gohar_014788 [Gossypium harknessii]|uniref:DUF4283 domain-containing protein n=1 Tax=Gossypium harknessii TaxID=34285 RepID=A0A7J9FY97_9ROSI|nr:hypothetical protein [Gossypium harknessii]
MKVVTWIRLSGLLATMYKTSSLKGIGEMIGSMIMIDYKTDNSGRGRFAKMAINIDLSKPLILKAINKVKALYCGLLAEFTMSEFSGKNVESSKHEGDGFIMGVIE